MLSSVTILNYYCERGANPAFWAEPLNAITNGGFILAALSGLVLVSQRPSSQRSLWHWFFILNFIAIGIGSFLFHSIPNGFTVAADTTPITIFMLSYIIFAMRYFVRLPWPLVAAALGIFLALNFFVVPNIKCWQGQVYFFSEIPAGARGRCLNDSLGYGTALLFMLVTGAWLAYKRHAAAPLVLLAGITFLVSLTFRSLDREVCDSFILFGTKTGTHFLWHILNSVTLFILLLAAIRHWPHAHVIPPKPKPARSSYGVS